MSNSCTTAVERLPQNDVNASRTTETFQLNEGVFARCVDSKSDYFQMFCLYPPTQNLLDMCQDPNTFDPSFLFSQMLEYQFTSVAQLPALITYPRFSGSGDWTPQPNLQPVVGPNIVLDESVTGHNEWFIGTTTVPLASLPTPIPPNVAIVQSQHSLIRVVETSSTLQVQFANVPQMIVADVNRVTRLYNNGNMRVFANALDAENNIILWESFTSDQFGSDVVFTELSQPFQVTVPGTVATLVSANGVYMVIVTSNTATIAFHAFNNPRFTSSTLQHGTIDSAISAQSRFCFQALNQNQSTARDGRSDLVFADSRCNCIASDRLSERIFVPKTFGKLPETTRLFLRDTTPCILRNCQMMPSEYTNANLHLANQCISSNGFCQSLLPDNSNPTLFVSQDCIVNLAPCVTSSDCPLGSSCRNRQCFLNCTPDLPCLKANPLASCVNGQCQVANPSKTSSKTTNWLWFGIALCVVIFVVLLVLLVYFAMRKR